MTDEEVDAIVMLVAGFASWADPCYYDHHGYCQTHSLHDKPCPYGVLSGRYNLAGEVEVLLRPHSEG